MEEISITRKYWIFKPVSESPYEFHYIRCESKSHIRWFIGGKTLNGDIAEIRQIDDEMQNILEQEYRDFKSKPKFHDIDLNTRLIVIKDWPTPYQNNYINTVASVKYWSLKLGKTSSDFIQDLKSGRLDDWFKLHEKEA